MQEDGWLAPEHCLNPALLRALASCLGHKDRSVLCGPPHARPSRPPISELDARGVMLVTPDAQGQQAAVLLQGLSSMLGTEKNGVCSFPGDLNPEASFPMLVPLPTSSLSPFSNQDVLGEETAERHRQKPQSFLTEPGQLGRLKPEEPTSESLLTHPKEEGHKPFPLGKRALEVVHLPGCCVQTVHGYWPWRF